jgi:enoyl-CoA hydratase
MLRYEVTGSSGAVALVTLDRPESRNALTNALISEIKAAMARADADDAVSAVVLTGADPAFCAGMDLREMGQLGMPTEDLDSGGAHWWAAITKPVIGAINGAAVTGGLELALACDVLIGSDRARFADTHARVGLIPGAGLTVLLPQAIGLRSAKEMSLTGRFVDAQEAKDLGLLARVVPHEDLIATALAMGDDVAACVQPAVRELKALYDDVALLPLDRGRVLEGERAAAWAAHSGGADVIESRREQVIARGRSLQS